VLTLFSLDTVDLISKFFGLEEDYIRYDFDLAQFLTDQQILMSKRVPSSNNA